MVGFFVAMYLLFFLLRDGQQIAQRLRAAVPLAPRAKARLLERLTTLMKGVALIAFGVVVIGLVDNLLRPLLVGSDTHLPDHVILISTIGGMALLGLNGFVIGPLFAATCIAAWDLRTESRAVAASDDT